MKTAPQKPFPNKARVIITFPVGLPPVGERKEVFVKDWSPALDFVYAWRSRFVRWLVANPV